MFICLWQFVNLGYSILVGCERKSCYLVLLVKSFKMYFVWLLCHHHKKSFSHASVLRHGVLGYETQWFKKINKYKHACVAKGCVTELWQFQSIVNRQGICPDEGCLSSKLRPICQCQPVFLFWLQGHVSPSLQNDFYERKNSLFKKKTFYFVHDRPVLQLKIMVFSVIVIWAWIKYLRYALFCYYLSNTCAGLVNSWPQQGAYT